MAFPGNAFQQNAFQNNAFQIRTGGTQGVPLWDGGFYSPDEDEELKKRHQELDALEALLREDKRSRESLIREAAREAYHAQPIPTLPPSEERKPSRPPFLPPPAGPIAPWSLAKTIAGAPLPPLAVPPVAPPPDPLEAQLQQATAQLDALDFDPMFAQAMAQIETLDIDAMLAADPEYQRMMQLLEKL